MDNRHIGFNFSVIIAPIELRGNFSAVSGLGAEIDYEEYNEGGNFTSPVYLPKGTKYKNIVLQRGTVALEPLAAWFSAVQTGVQLRYPMIITMLDGKGFPVKVWTVMDCLPVKVAYSEMSALSDNIAVTSIELIHGEIIGII